jgi:hypothetical protein
MGTPRNTDRREGKRLPHTNRAVCHSFPKAPAAQIAEFNAGEAMGVSPASSLAAKIGRESCSGRPVIDVDPGAG